MSQNKLFWRLLFLSCFTPFAEFNISKLLDICLSIIYAVCVVYIQKWRFSTFWNDL
jgi:hypothetical protein